MPTPLQALQSVDHSGLLSSKGEPKHLQPPIQQKRVIDDRPNAALPTNARFVRPYDYARAEREDFMHAAQSHPDRVPYEQLKPGDLVVSKSPYALSKSRQHCRGVLSVLCDRIYVNTCPKQHVFAV